MSYDVWRSTEDKGVAKMYSNHGCSKAYLKWVFYELPPLCFAEVDSMGEGQAERSGDTEGIMEMEQTLSSLTESESSTKTDGMALWRHQTCANTKVRMLN